MGPIIYLAFVAFAFLGLRSQLPEGKKGGSWICLGICLLVAAVVL